MAVFDHKIDLFAAFSLVGVSMVMTHVDLTLSTFIYFHLSLKNRIGNHLLLCQVTVHVWKGELPVHWTRLGLV